MIEITFENIMIGYGALLSTALLGYELYKYYIFEKPRLRVDVNVGIIGEPTGPLHAFIAEAINDGRRPIKLHSCGIALNTKKNSTWNKPYEFPHKIEEGEKMTTYMSINKIKEQIKEVNDVPLFFWFRDATGKIHKNDSKYFKNLMRKIKNNELN